MSPNTIGELVGALGLPGAFATLTIAFFFGAKTWQLLRNGKNVSLIDGVSYRDAVGMSQSVVALADKGKDLVMENVDRTRDEINANLSKVHADLLVAVHEQTTQLGEKLDKVAGLLMIGNERRRKDRGGE